MLGTSTLIFSKKRGGVKRKDVLGASRTSAWDKYSNLCCEKGELKGKVSSAQVEQVLGTSTLIFAVKRVS